MTESPLPSSVSSSSSNTTIMTNDSTTMSSPVTDVVVAIVDNISEILTDDDYVKIAGVDCDGILRGKVIAKSKFLASATSGIAMSSAIFGWDMHDELYTTETTIATAEQGYADLLGFPDLASYRRLPFDDNMPFFLIYFGAERSPVAACGRSMMRDISRKLENAGCRGLAGVELEFMNFRTPTQDSYLESGGAANMAAYLETHSPKSLQNISNGMFGYSVSRPEMYKDYFRQLLQQSKIFGCDIEGLHTESGPGVIEAALNVSPLEQMADKVTLFKLMAKSIGIEKKITPCFMAKPRQGLPGNSGHIHVSLVDHETGANLFARETKDLNAEWEDIAWLSDMGRQFLAGLLDALPDLMPMLAPTVNSYKRLVENYWAPIDVSWGLEHRLSSIRLIAPPVAKPSATRLEVRIPGADMHPHYALNAIVAAGWRGVEKKMVITVPPSSTRAKTGEKAALLPNTLDKALARFSASTSVAREILGDDFVGFYTVTREHELRLYRESVSDWEFARYIETV